MGDPIADAMRALGAVLQRALVLAGRKDMTAKLNREAFIYLLPKAPYRDFADCKTCRMFLPGKRTCAIMAGVVKPDDSCGLYVHGEPDDTQAVKWAVTKDDAGFVHGPVRCENCAYGGETCGLYEKLNKALPEVFDLEETIEPKACCNAWVKA